MMPKFRRFPIIVAKILSRISISRHIFHICKSIVYPLLKIIFFDELESGSVESFLRLFLPSIWDLDAVLGSPCHSVNSRTVDVSLQIEGILMVRRIIS